jgi:hypothetical protein
MGEERSRSRGENERASRRSLVQTMPMSKLLLAFVIIIERLTRLLSEGDGDKLA